MILKSNIDLTSSEYLKNYEHNKKLIDSLKSKSFKIIDHSPELKKIQNQRNKLTARHRIKLLKDPYTQILETSLFAGYNLYEDFDLPAAGIITCVVKIHDRLCMVFANDQMVKAGTYFPITIKKHLRNQLIAFYNHLPCIYLVDSGGAYLNMAADVFADRDHFGRIFYHQALLSSEKITQIASVHGHCTAGGAYIPAMAEQTIMVKNQAKIFLAGPPLVKAATSQDVSSEMLGGYRLHSEESGLTDYVAEDDQDAIKIIRSLIKNSPENKNANSLVFSDKIHTQDIAPLYPAEEILGIIPQKSSILWNPKELLARIIDRSEFCEFKQNYGKNIICGWAEIYGMKFGVLANYGLLDKFCAQKATHFIHLCQKNNQVLLFLQNISGFSIGIEAEASGIAKEGAKMVHAVSCTNSPKITIIVGGSHGAGNYAMCGRAYDGDFLFVYPNAKTSIMSAKNAAEVLKSIKKNNSNANSAKKAVDFDFIDNFEKSCDAYYSSARLWDDGVINPVSTREVLKKALAVCENNKIRTKKSGLVRN